MNKWMGFSASLPDEDAVTLTAMRIAHDVTSKRYGDVWQHLSVTARQEVLSTITQNDKLGSSLHGGRALQALDANKQKNGIGLLEFLFGGSPRAFTTRLPRSSGTPFDKNTSDTTAIVFSHIDNGTITPVRFVYSGTHWLFDGRESLK